MSETPAPIPVERPPTPAAMLKTRQIPFLVGYSALLASGRTVLQARTTDILFDDETAALKAGLDFFRTAPPRGENSPLYAFWYWLVSRAVPDPLMLYYASWGLLLFGNLLALAFALRLARVQSFGVGLALSIASLLSCFAVWPYVTLLATMLVIAASAWALSAKSDVQAFSVAALLLAFATFVRPELLYSFALCYGAVLFTAMRRRQWSWDVLLPVMALGGLWIAFGAPFGGGRTAVAFGQHYALNVAQASQLEFDSWNNWIPIVAADFGDARTPLAALAANPGAFAWHAATNLANLGPAAIEIALPQIPAPQAVRLALGLPLVLVLVAGMLRTVLRVRREERALRIVVLASAILAPSIVSVVVIAPRLHYLVPPFAVCAVMGSCGLRDVKVKHARVVLGCVVGVTLLAVWGIAAGARSGPLPNVATVRFLRSLNISGKPLILEPDFGRGVYAGWEFERIGKSDCTPFAECVQRRKPSLIIADRRLAGQFATDLAFQAFVRASHLVGYEDRQVPGTDVHVYVRRQPSHP